MTSKDNKKDDHILKAKTGKFDVSTGEVLATTSADSKFIVGSKPEQTQMFSNPIDTDNAFGITRNFTDNYKGLLDEITPDTASSQYDHRKTFKAKNKAGKELALRVSDPLNKIQNADQFYNALAKIKDAKVLQTLLSLWNYSNKQGKFLFNGTRLSNIMRTVLKGDKRGYFTQEQKREFTRAIHILRDFEIYLDQTITETDDRGKKKKMTKRDFYRLIDLIGAVYAKKKDGSTDDSVIVKVYGELLPRLNKGIMRGRLYSRGLLELDANKDANAILLGFKLLTRFDQLRQAKKGSKDIIPDDKLFIEVDRKNLIEWAGYQQTDNQSHWLANKYLKKTLDKLIDIKCLNSYSPDKIPIKDDDKITLKPHPIALKIENNGQDIKQIEDKKG